MDMFGALSGQPNGAANPAGATPVLASPASASPANAPGILLGPQAPPRNAQNQNPLGAILTAPFALLGSLVSSILSPLLRILT